MPEPEIKRLRGLSAELEAEIAQLRTTAEAEFERSREAEQTLREARGLNTLILNSSRDCTVVLDPEGHTLFVSPGGIEAMEMSDVDAILGLSWLRVWQGADHDAACAAVAAATAGGTGRFQGFCPTHKGTPKWWDVVISPIAGADGSPVRLVSVGRDITELKQTEQRLAQSEERLNMALGAAGNIGVWDWDLTTDLICADKTIARFFSLDERAAVDGVPIADLTRRMHPDDVPALRAALDRVFSGAPIYSSQYRVLDDAGGERWLAGHGRVVRDAQGKPVRFTGASIDITEHKRAEAALRGSEAQFRTFAQAMPNHVWAAPPNGLLDWFNERVYEYSGFEAGALDGLGWTAMVHADDLAAASEHWGAALASGNAYETEFRLRRADGSYRWHLGRAMPIRGADGAITRWIGTNTDIEEQRAAREALANLNATLEARVEERTRERDRAWKNSRDLQVVVDEDGTIRAANEAWTTILGWLPHEVVGRNHLDFNHPDDTGAGKVLATAADGLLPSYDSRVRHHDGSYRWISWVAAPEQGLIYANGRHVTAEKQAAEDLLAAQEQLRQSQKMEAVGQLTGGVAHDFNNLLQVISGNLHLVGKGIAGNEALERRVTNAQAAVRRGAKLASQLLAFSRRQALEPKVVNVGKLVVGMEDMLRRAIGETIEIEAVVSSGLWNTLVDPAQIENALLNLAINARDAMSGSGRLTIEVGNAFLDDDYARAHADVAPGQYVVIAVSDTGSGMAPEVMAQVFEPFFTTKPLGTGTGLGLSMVYGFVKQSGGHVNVYSKVGHGTTMKLYLPRAHESEDVVATIANDPVSGGSETILVAEDDEAVRDTVVEMLGELGYRVLKAADAASALTVIESGIAIDLLFTDVVMPGSLQSPELARKARELLPRIAVLFTSGYTRNAIVHGGRLDPGVDLLNKPYTRDALARKVRQVLGARPRDTPGK
jgi:PAS domain S-box-containing protein